MILDKKEGELRFNCDRDGLYVQNPIASHFVLVEKYGYESCYVSDSRVRVSKERLKTDFEAVSNYQSIDYTKKDGFKGNYFLHKHRMFDFYVRILMDSHYEEEYINEDLETVGESFSKVERIYYKSGGDDLEQVVNCINELFDFNYDSSSKVNIVLKTTTGFQFKEVPIKPMPIDVDTMYNDDFKETYEHLVRHLESSNKGLALLYGAAGTGKTNLIRHLTTVVPDKRFVFIPVTMVSSLTDPMFLSTLIDNQGSILVLEDCENYIKDRKAGDINSVVSSILNMTDGILSDVLGLKVICTFNSKIEDIDKALLRRGRLICEYEFKPLTDDKASKLITSLGVESKDSPRTLADIFNQAPPSSSAKTTKKIGFGSN